MLELTFNNFTSQKKYSKNFFFQIAETALAVFGLEKKQVGLSINLVDKARMRALNHRYHHQDKATDVLSFPLGQSQNGGILELGDVFICLKLVWQRAEQEKHLPEDWLKRMIIHGLLHLLGYDHEKSTIQAKEMFALEEKILKKLR